MRLIACFAAVLLSVQLSGQEKKVQVKQVPPSVTNPTSGADMFKAYCASCHGLKAKGDGPAVPALKSKPPDLTMMAKANGGQFPSMKIYNSIEGDSMMPAHGSKDMPVWGDVFRSMSRDEGTRRMRLHNLTKYLESLQAK